MSRHIRVEELLGRQVVDRSGRRVGRIEAVEVRKRDGEWLVDEFHVGVFALFDRLASFRLVRVFLHGTRLTRSRPYRIRWNELDLSDPLRPRLSVPADRVVSPGRASHAA